MAEPAKANGHRDPAVRRIRDSEPPPRRGHGPSWSQLGWIGSVVAAAVAATWLLSMQFGALSREIGEVKSDVRGIHERLDRVVGR